MKKINVLFLFSLCLWSCSKSENQNASYAYSGIYTKYNRTQEMTQVVEKYDTFPLTVTVRTTQDSIFFESTEIYAKGGFLKNSEQIYKRLTMSGVPQHIFELFGDSLDIGYAWSAPMGPSATRHHFAGVKQ